ncbi:hypothetical protein PENSPDRAFT_595331, partial [Peniophora sp. CONT]
MLLLDSAVKHDVFVNPKSNIRNLREQFKKHEREQRPCCRGVTSIFKPCGKRPQQEDEQIRDSQEQPAFPPKPPSESLKRRIISDFCEEMSPDNVIEEGCAVCGCLHLSKDMVGLTEDLFDWDLLRDPSHRITRAERRRQTDPLTNIAGPVLAPNCKKVCPSCLKSLKKDRVPKLALVNGNWVGEVPPELQGLTLLEQMMIARLRHNACVLKVHASGQYKMKANAVMFSVPMPKVYKALPPSKEELEEIVAFIFIGPTRPTEEMHARLPSFVRRERVRKALEWLKLNHEDYSDLEISYENLNTYPEAGPPVIPDYRPQWVEKELENKAVHELEDWSSVEEGECPLIVHTLT